MAISGTIAAAGIGAAGSIMSSKNAAKAAEKGSTSTTVPWAEQQPYLTDAWRQAQQNYQTSQNSPYYQGQLYGGINDVQRDGLTGIQTWAHQQGNDLAGTLGGAAHSALDQGITFGNVAANGAQGNWGAGIAGDQSGSLATFGNNALNQAGNFNNAVWNTINTAKNDPTQANISAAGQYAANPYLQSQIDAASADVTDQLGTGLVGLNNQASAGGNLNSSRAGAAEAEMRGQAARTIGNMSATMRSNAYQSGLQLAENARQSNNANNLSALGVMDNYMGQGAGALNSVNAQRNAEIGNRIASNGQLAGQTGLGLQLATGANNMQMGNQQAIVNAGGVYQQDHNNQLQANYQQWQGQDRRSTDLLKRYYEIVGGQGWGGTTNQTNPYAGQGAVMSGLQGAVGGVSTGLGLYGQFKNLFPTTSTPTSYTGGGMVGNNAVGGTGMLGGGV